MTVGFFPVTVLGRQVPTLCQANLGRFRVRGGDQVRQEGQGDGGGKLEVPEPAAGAGVLYWQAAARYRAAGAVSLPHIGGHHR